MHVFLEEVNESCISDPMDRRGINCSTRAAIAFIDRKASAAEVGLAALSS
jgi:hypothetical protein